MKTLPPSLYKYQRISDLSLASLADASVWASIPRDFNDPFDCALQVCPAKLSPEILADLRARDLGLISEIESDMASAGLADTDIAERIEHTYRSAIEDAFTRACAEVLGAWGVVCLCERHDDILMWSHYTDGHRGMCLEFDTKEEPFSWSRPVSYVPRAPEVDPRLVLDHATSARTVLDPLILSKYEAWQYEREWRIVMRRGAGPVKYYPRALRAVYFGAATAASQRSQVIQALSGRDVRFFLMERDARGFGLTPRQVSDA